MDGTDLGTVGTVGQGFFSLLGFTLQMSLIIIFKSRRRERPAGRTAVERIAGLAHDGPRVATLVALLAMLSSWLNWGFR